MCRGETVRRPGMNRHVPAQETPMRPDRRTGAAAWLVTGITLAGAALRVSTLDTRSFWLDETTSVRQASWSIAEMLARMADNVHPPLFHTLLHYWLATFGRDEIIVRVFPLLWGIVAIPLMYWVARSVYDRRVGLIAAAVLAVSPFFVWYAQEARMYTMMLVFALLCTGAMWRAMQGNRPAWWVLYALATAAGLMTQYFFVFLVAGQGAYMVLFHLRHRERALEASGDRRLRWTRPWGVAHDAPELLGWLAASAVAAVPLLWWVPKVLAHPDLLRGVSGAFNYGGPAPAVGVHFNELILVPVQWAFGFHSELATRDLVAMWPLLITLVFVSAGLARRVSPRTWYLISCGIGGAAIIVALGQWQPIVLESRYFTAVAVPLVILSARAMSQLRAPALRTVFGIVLVVALASWADQSFNPDSIVKWDNRAAMGIVADGYRPGDAILLIPNFVSSIPEYYLPADAYASLRTVPSFDAKGRPRNRAPQLAEDLYRQVGPSRRVWLIATWQDTPRIESDRTMTAAWLAGQGFAPKQDRQLHRIRVTLFEAGRQGGFFIGTGVAP
jgi:uncharacterized membrane protein